MRRVPAHLTAAVVAMLIAVGDAKPAPAQAIFDLQREFPKTDFANRSVSLGEIYTGRPRRNTIAPIYRPDFVPVDEVRDVGPLEPVLSVGIDGDFRAYPLRILLFREIVNDVVGATPILVTYCPLCNSGVVYDRRVAGEVLTFGNTGRLRRLDMVIFDHKTESWWQQFTGEAFIGAMTGTRLDLVPSRLESLQRFRERAPGGRVLVPPRGDRRPFGLTTSVGLDDLPIALARERYPHHLPEGINPIERVVVVGRSAWTLTYLRQRKSIEFGDLVITWVPGQNSVHDTAQISKGRDVGNVIVQRRTAQGLVEIPYDVSFAFAFSNFVPNGTINQ